MTLVFAFWPFSNPQSRLCYHQSHDTYRLANQVNLHYLMTSRILERVSAETSDHHNKHRRFWVCSSLAFIFCDDLNWPYRCNELNSKVKVRRRFDLVLCWFRPLFDFEAWLWPARKGSSQLIQRALIAAWSTVKKPKELGLQLSFSHSALNESLPWSQFCLCLFHFLLLNRPAAHCEWPH